VDWEILRGLNEGERRAVLRSTTRRRFRKGEVVFHEGDLGESLHLLDRGRAAVRVSTPEGDHVTIGVIGPGAFFGEQALVGTDNHRMASVIALEPLETLALRRDDFSRLRADHPMVDSVLVTALSERVNRLTDQLVEALFVAAEKRLCRRLLELADIYAANESGGPVSIPLTQEELATLAGTSRPTVNRVLQELVQADIAHVRRGGVEVIDPGRLAARCR